MPSGLVIRKSPDQGIVGLLKGVGKGSSKRHHRIEDIVGNMRGIAHVQELSRFHRSFGGCVRHVKAMKIELNR